MNSYSSIFKIVLHGRSAGKILLATIFSFTFSIAVILCTFGLMDGFDHQLKSGLRHSSGDILVTSRKGFFEVTPELNQSLNKASPLSLSPVIQTEAFAMANEMSKGVLVRGVDSQKFTETTGLKMNISRGGVVIGAELAKALNVSMGDSIGLTFGRGNEASEALPLIQTFTITGLVRHGIFQKDLRFVYLDRDDLSELLGLEDRVNLVILTTESLKKPLASLQSIEDHQRVLINELSPEFIVRPFWYEYDFLLQAVKVEKFSISLILQLIVLVAIFNIVAFVIYIMEKKSQDFFFLRAVGLSLSALNRFWFVSILLIWSISCFGAYLATIFFNWCLEHVSFLQIPGEIYVLSSLRLRLDLVSYLTVYGISLLWILIASFIGYLRLKRKPIILGLRQEFSS
jgi:ABC-type lipoprotein release transport system permease subunit